jgi:phosphopantetheine adenylyltransferase
VLDDESGTCMQINKQTKKHLNSTDTENFGKSRQLSTTNLAICMACRGYKRANGANERRKEVGSVLSVIFAIPSITANCMNEEMGSEINSTQVRDKKKGTVPSTARAWLTCPSMSCVLTG